MPIRARNEITSDFILSLISRAPAFLSSSVPLSDLKSGTDQEILSAFFAYRASIFVLNMGHCSVVAA
jgi:hypothetical protein